MAAATVTPVTALNVPGQRYVADVEWVNVNDTDPTITHLLGIANVQVVVTCISAGTVASNVSVNYGAASTTAFTMTKNSTAANTTFKCRVDVRRPHSLVGSG